ncbi:MAG TPA: cation diffusion facilitator family transporter [Vicinamibacterales bacterium]|nr:cation diffusion facilitator family transporter [Vicinamibacterales bacterium]
MAAAEGSAVLSRDRYGAVATVLRRVLAANLAVAAAKLGYGYLTASVAIASDGYHSLTDALSNVVGLVGLRAARKPPDPEHPYGHRKYETLAAAAIVVALVFVIQEVVREAVGRLQSGAAPRVTAASFGLMLATLAVNLVVVRYESRQGRRLASELLLADAMHTRSDVVTSLGVLASLAAVRLGYPAFDGIGGFVVALFIAHAGWELAKETSRILSDRIVLDAGDLRAVVMSVPGILGCHQIRTRGSADHVFLDLHIWMAPETRLDEAHRLSHVVKDRLMAKYPQIADAVIHLEPPPPGALGDGWT